MSNQGTVPQLSRDVFVTESATDLMTDVVSLAQNLLAVCVYYSGTFTSKESKINEAVDNKSTEFLGVFVKISAIEFAERIT